MKKSLGPAPVFNKKISSMTQRNSPKDLKPVNFKIDADFKDLVDNFCHDNKITQKKLFMEGAKLYMDKY